MKLIKFFIFFFILFFFGCSNSFEKNFDYQKFFLNEKNIFTIYMPENIFFSKKKYEVYNDKNFFDIPEIIIINNYKNKLEDIYPPLSSIKMIQYPKSYLNKCKKNKENLKINKTMHKINECSKLSDLNLLSDIYLSILQNLII